MMNYEIFKEVVKEKFMDYMPEKFKGMELVAEPVEKVNVTLDGIILREEGRNISPTIYINNMYKKYQDCGDLEETLMAACDFMERAYEQAPVVDVDSIMKDANEKIVFQLINTEQNKTFLEQVPHREFQDLSIVYKVIISADKDAVQSSKITNEFAKRLGMSEEQLFKCAAENTRRLFPPVVRSMNDIMKEMFARDGMPQEIADMMIAEIPPEQTMWVISNEKGINGAASMLYENELHELAESLESDLYILPSSVHEVIAVSSDMGSPEMLAQMVVEVNMQEVSLDERLSNQVYHYDKDLRKLTLATDTPNKRLEKKVPDQPEFPMEKMLFGEPFPWGKSDKSIITCEPKNQRGKRQLINGIDQDTTIDESSMNEVVNNWLRDKYPDGCPTAPTECNDQSVKDDLEFLKKALNMPAKYADYMAKEEE